jgi:hypothetical protein
MAIKVSFKYGFGYVQAEMNKHPVRIYPECLSLGLTETEIIGKGQA